MRDFVVILPMFRSDISHAYENLKQGLIKKKHAILIS